MPHSPPPFAPLADPSRLGQASRLCANKSSLRIPNVAQRRGYTITNSKGLWGARLIEFETLDSTNTWCLEHAAQCRHGDVIVARMQTRGRGRFQRDWLSLAEKSLTLSIYLDPTRFNAEQLHSLGPRAALAVRRTLSRRGMAATVKWPNDVLVKNRKISGILLEGDSTSLVLGIGINLSMTRKELAAGGLDKIATSIFLQTGMVPQYEAFRRALLSNLSVCLGPVTSPQSAITEWRRHDALTGRSIIVHTTNARISGRYAGITEDWRLLLQERPGLIHVLSAGDVTLRN